MSYTRQEIAVYERIRFNAVAKHVLLLAATGVLFVALRMCGVLSLDWWWTTAPFTAAVAHSFGAVFHVATLRTANQHPNK